MDLPPTLERSYRVCAHCVMDATDPEITFDAEGVCNHCHAYVARAARELLPPDVARARLDRLVAQIRTDGEGKPYDCVIGVSGGVDSTMVAYTVKQLGLRPLAVHLDNGWDSELAVHNIEQTLKRLGIDLHTHVVDWEEFRELQLSFFKASVANVEVLTDHAIFALLFQTASRMGIKYLISGGNIVTEAVMPSSWMYDNRDLRHITGIQRRFGTRRIKSLPRCSLIRYAYYVLVRRVKYIPILNYVHYDKAAAKELIMRELGWRDYGGKHYESIFTRFFQAYYLPVKFKMDKRRPHLSTLILSGQITRVEALRELERDLYTADQLRDDIEYFKKKMRLSQVEYEAIMNAPIKTYADYPSNAFLFARNTWMIDLVKKIVRPRSLRH